MLEQLDFYLDNYFWPRMDGLTDDEYLWQPAAGSWTIHPRGDGTFSYDWAYPPPEPNPVTTIAWRICHLGGGIVRMATNRHFGDGKLSFADLEIPGTAARGLRMLKDALDEWRAGARNTTVSSFGLNVEVIAHGAEMCLLRDLYRAN